MSMDVYFGVGGELLAPLDELMDGDIKLSLELDLELKDPINNGIAACADDWGGWGSLRSSPSLDLFGDKETCIMVSPEAVMPFIKREIKHEPPPSPTPLKAEVNPLFRPHDSLILECEQVENEEGLTLEQLNEMIEEEEVDEEDDDEEDEEDDDEPEEEEEEEEEEEQVVKEVKILPKERSLWNSAILTKPAVVKQENGVMNGFVRQKTEIIVAKAHTASIQPQQTVRVLHAMKKSTHHIDSSNHRTTLIKRIVKEGEGGYPKPAYSYSCLIAMALKNSITGSLPVSEIYNFMCEHFPYFKSAPSGWKNSVRHNLSLNKCFEKIEKGGANGGCRKGCLWALNPDKAAKMDDEVAKWSKKDPSAIRRAMKYPDELERLERGDLKIGSRRESYDSGAEEDESSDSSDSDTEEVPPSLKRFDSRLSSQESNDLGLPDEMYEELGLLEEVMSSDAETEPGPQMKRIRLALDSYNRQSVRPV